MSWAAVKPGCEPSGAPNHAPVTLRSGEGTERKWRCHGSGFFNWWMDLNKTQGQSWSLKTPQARTNLLIGATSETEPMVNILTGGLLNSRHCDTWFSCKLREDLSLSLGQHPMTTTTPILYFLTVPYVLKRWSFYFTLTITKSPDKLSIATKSTGRVFILPQT